MTKMNENTENKNYNVKHNLSYFCYITYKYLKLFSDFTNHGIK